VNELINQRPPLFIGKLLGREERYERYEVSHSTQYAEKHFEPPFISSNHRYARAAVRYVL
jgi:hypothetical protein